jgi:hypothetical protein
VPLQCVADDFATLNMSRWLPYAMGPTLQATGGQIVITPAPSMNGYAGLNLAAFDFTSGHVSIEVPQVVNQPNVENYILVFVTNQNYYAISYDGGRMHYYRREAGVDLASTELYDPTLHRHWRIGHEAGDVYFSTSANGTTWTERYRVPATVPITNIKFELAAGSYAGGTATPGEARFDNFQLCLP